MTQRKQARLRVCGLHFRKNTILLLKHEGIGKRGYLWAPPGGRVEFGEDVVTNLQREYAEETNINVDVGPYLFTYEYLGHGLHAVELFFEVFNDQDEPSLGYDPEMEESKQMLTELRYFSMEEIRKEGFDYFHGIFSKIEELGDLTTISGYLRVDES